MSQEIMLILVMAVPMLIFSIYPGLKLGDYLKKKYNLQEKQERQIIIVTTITFTITLSSLTNYL
ncbi:MAG: hypothetical protein L3J10_08810 [Sulfurimonas sp.]|nr:hypothetical protein [Sulfurimonas sp.]